MTGIKVLDIILPKDQFAHLKKLRNLERDDYMIEKLNIGEVGEKLEKYLHPVSAMKEPEILFALAATAYERKNGKEILNKIRDYDTKEYLENFTERYFVAVEKACEELGLEELRNFIIVGEGYIKNYGNLANGVSDLIIRLAEVKTGDIFLNIGGGSGILFKEEMPIDVNLIDIEQDKSMCRIVHICSAITGRTVQVRKKSIFEPGLDWLQANKVFINFSAMRYRDNVADTKEKIRNNPALMKFYGEKEPEVSIWNYVLAALESQVQPGKTVALLNNREDLINDRGANFRRELVKSGRLESVISLSKGILNPFSGFYMMIFSQGNEKIKLVDASEIFSKLEGQHNYFRMLEKKDIDKILDLLESGGRIFTTEKLEENGYKLLPDTEFLNELDRQNRLKNLPSLSQICRIYRGDLSAGSNKILEMASTEETNFKYLHLRDVVDGIIDKFETSLTNIDERAQEKFCAVNNTLVMGKNAPMRIGILQIPDNVKVLLGGNVYALEVTDKNFNPIYLMLYLQSEDAMQRLRKALKGNSPVQMLSLADLRQMKIQPVPIERQNEIAEKYLQLQAEMKILKDKENSLMNEIKSLQPDEI